MWKLLGSVHPWGTQNKASPVSLPLPLRQWPGSTVWVCLSPPQLPPSLLSIPCYLRTEKGRECVLVTLSSRSLEHRRGQVQGQLRHEQRCVETASQGVSCKAASCPGPGPGRAERRARRSVKVCAALAASQPLHTEPGTRGREKVHLKAPLLHEMLFTATA